jgi:hypothetical protein
MACCGVSEKDHKPVLLQFLFFSLFSIFACTGIILFSLMAVVKREFFKYVVFLAVITETSAVELWKNGLRALRENPLRCNVSSRIYPISAPVAGFVYRRFNILIFGAVLLVTLVIVGALLHWG